MKRILESYELIIEGIEGKTHTEKALIGMAIMLYNNYIFDNLPLTEEEECIHEWVEFGTINGCFCPKCGTIVPF